jgi:hypothetical protein
MEKLLAFILVLSHVNTSMLLPQVQKDDVYDKSGGQVDDINSVVEFVMVHLGIDHYADDEGNDSGQNFHVVKIFDYCYQPVFTQIKTTDSFATKQSVFGEYKEDKIPCVSFDIITHHLKLQYNQAFSGVRDNKTSLNQFLILNIYYDNTFMAQAMHFYIIYSSISILLGLFSK